MWFDETSPTHAVRKSNDFEKIMLNREWNEDQGVCKLLIDCVWFFLLKRS